MARTITGRLYNLGKWGRRVESHNRVIVAGKIIEEGKNENDVRGWVGSESHDRVKAAAG